MVPSIGMLCHSVDAGPGKDMCEKRTQFVCVSLNMNYFYFVILLALYSSSPGPSCFALVINDRHG